MIVICYEGSDDARAAIEQAAHLFPGRPATVLTVWQPFMEVAARTSIGFGLIPSLPGADEIDAASGQTAEKTAAQGAELAVKLGLDAQPLSASHWSTTAHGILAESDRLGAEAIVMGSRGLTGVKSLLLGSVSHEVVQHANRAVVVVPSREVAAARTREARAEDDG